MLLKENFKVSLGTRGAFPLYIQFSLFSLGFFFLGCSLSLQNNTLILFHSTFSLLPSRDTEIFLPSLHMSMDGSETTEEGGTVRVQVGNSIRAPPPLFQWHRNVISICTLSQVQVPNSEEYKIFTFPPAYTVDKVKVGARSALEFLEMSSREKENQL